MDFVWANVKEVEEAEVVLFGVPDDAGSPFSGAALGPDSIRKVSVEMESFYVGKEQFLFMPEAGVLSKKLFDAGNLSKEQVEFQVEEWTRQKKISVCLGGDHSITFEVLKGIYRARKKRFGIAYFDAHPDMVGSIRNHYGSIVYDAIDAEIIDPQKTVLIGIRAPEEEEVENITKFKILKIGPTEIVEECPQKIVNKILDTLSFPTYISVDMDVLDPAVAPGVSNRVPGGLMASELFFFVKKIASKGLLGLDVMETNPNQDHLHLTSHLAARLVAEALSV